MSKKTSANIVLAKCGVKLRIENQQLFRRRCFSIQLIFCKLAVLKKHRLRLVELELKFFVSPALRQYFFRYTTAFPNIMLK